MSADLNANAAPNPVVADDAAPRPMPVTDTRNHRFWFPIAVLTLASTGYAVQYARFMEQPTLQKMWFMFIWPATLFLVFLWWLFGSGYSWRTRLAGTAVATAAWAIPLSLFRLEDFRGDMLPRFVWRFSPTSEELARKFYEKSASDPAPDEPKSAAVWDVTPADWPGFRGVRRNSEVQGGTVDPQWIGSNPQPLWKQPIGVGWSSFSGVGDVAWTQDQLGDEERVLALNVATGDVRWIHVDATRWIEPVGGHGPRGTPTFYDGRLYTQGATGILNCLDAATGEKIWSRNILEDAGDGKPVENVTWAMSASPWVTETSVLVNPGGMAGRSVISYDRLTGEIQWAAGNRPASYAGISPAQFGGEPQWLAFHGTGLSGHAVDDGRELWFFPWEPPPQVNASQPIPLPDDGVLISSGYDMGSVALTISKSASGWTTEERWRTRKFELKFNDGVVRDGHVYGLADGILSCMNLDTGKITWKKGRYGFGQVLLAGDMLIVVSEAGEIVFVPARSDGFEELGRVQAIEGVCWNHPAVVRGKLLVRNNREAACFQLWSPPAPEADQPTNRPEE